MHSEKNSLPLVEQLFSSLTPLRYGAGPCNKTNCRRLLPDDSTEATQLRSPTQLHLELVIASQHQNVVVSVEAQAKAAERDITREREKLWKEASPTIA